MSGLDLPIQFQLSLRAETQFGQTIYALGDIKEFGLWQLAGGVALITDKNSYPLWTSKIITVVGGVQRKIEYKYVKVKDGRLQHWEQLDGNRRLTLDPRVSSVQVISDIWGQKLIPAVQPASSVVPSVPSAPSVPATLPPLSSDDEFISQLVILNSTHLSWKRKLEAIHSLLTDHTCTYAVLGTIAGYCHFIKSGLVRCEEEGAHYRPNNHAELSRAITEALGKVKDDRNGLLVRQILATLPSYKPAFTASVPLTRIRDIAHRNDIPSDLKYEIKTTLQNKLHRCAGPEDLVTSEFLLQKITAMQVNSDFLHEFQLFHSELKEFFNATGLEERLQDMATRGKLTAVIEEFLREKNQRGHNREEALTRLRQAVAGVETEEAYEAQSLLITDIDLTSFAFSCFSERINTLSDQLLPDSFPRAAKLVDLLLTNLALSDFEQEESNVLRREFALHPQGFPRTQNGLLRLKATCERTLRMTSEYSDQVSEIQPKVDELGRVLQLDRRAVSVFSEGLIRSQLPFQLSKIASLILRLVRKTGKFSPWLPILPGKCQGTVMYARDLSSVVLREPTILIVKQAEGDEEVPPYLVGLVVSHDLPQLSHLAVRLRQGKVVSTACETEDEVSLLQHVNGFGELTVSAGQVRLAEAFKREFRGEEPPSQVVVSAADVTVARVIPAERAEQHSCGAKAYMAGRLETLARSIAGFRTPKSACIPFGVYHKFVPKLPHTSREAALSYIDQQTLSLSSDMDSIAASVASQFRGCPNPLIFRSSANVEDTANISGAGLYDSIPNIPPTDPALISAAITGVWKSIATERAWNSREYNRLPHSSSLMGILVQELITPQYAFVVHTNSPFAGEGKVYVELAEGLGETLASGEQRGSPYRISFDKATHTLSMLALASYSFALVPTSSGLVSQRTDYSTEDLDYLQRFAVQIGEISLGLEQVLQAPQDIEGVISASEIWIVQSRPQV